MSSCCNWHPSRWGVLRKPTSRSNEWNASVLRQRRDVAKAQRPVSKLVQYIKVSILLTQTTSFSILQRRHCRFPDRDLSKETPGNFAQYQKQCILHKDLSVLHFYLRYLPQYRDLRLHASIRNTSVDIQWSLTLVLPPNLLINLFFSYPMLLIPYCIKDTTILNWLMRLTKPWQFLLCQQCSSSKFFTDVKTSLVALSQTRFASPGVFQLIRIPRMTCVLCSRHLHLCNSHDSSRVPADGINWKLSVNFDVGGSTLSVKCLSEISIWRGYVGWKAVLRCFLR